MFTHPNKVVAMMLYNYMLQPGDGTLYRFGFNYYPQDEEESYVLDSGAGYPDYVKLYINMPGGIGLGVVPLFQLKYFPEQTHMLDYLSGQGFHDVYPYTLVAVLLALKVLVENPQDVLVASKAMLAAQEIIMTIHKEEKDG